MEAVYAREFAFDGVSFTEESLSHALTRAWEDVHALPPGDRYGGIRGEEEFWRLFLNRVRRYLDGGVVSAESFGRLAAHFRDSRSWAIYEDVPGTLDDLERRGILLAVVSNWDSHLPDLLEGLGLARRFRAVLVSAIEETGKPDPEIFRRACARVGVALEESLHVGDSLREDYEGAQEAGLSALLLDREGRHRGTAGRIESLSEIPSRLAK